MRLLLWTICLTLLAGTAGAQDRPALRFDPDKIEFATPWAQSSPCLGDRSDPICFVQTMIVCGILETRPECSACRFGRYYNPQRHDRIEYRIARAGLVPFERLEAMQENLLGEYDLDRNPMTRRRAVTAQFVIRQSVCPAIDASCEGSLWTDILIVVERTPRGWIPIVYGPLFQGDWFAD
ncbi:MAG: hypothetical protein ACKO1J_15545 [Tagaea sp.]